MASFVGLVVSTGQGARFDNSDGTSGQRLTRAALGGNKFAQEIDLTPYIGRTIEVSGNEQHDWIFEAQILKVDQ